MILARATWRDVEALEREQTVVVIPIGGTEVQGLSAPLGAASLLNEAVLSRLDARLGERVLITPELAFGIAGASLSIPGTIDLGYDAFAATLRAIVTSLARHRFRKFLLLQGGPGRDTFSALQVAGRTLKDADPRLQIAIFDDRIAIPDWHLAILASIDPTLVRIVPGSAPRLDLVEERPEGEPESLPQADARRARESSFVTDANEGDNPEWATANETPDAARGAEYLQGTVDEVTELIGMMLADRVYLEWA